MRVRYGLREGSTEPTIQSRLCNCSRQRESPDAQTPRPVCRHRRGQAQDQTPHLLSHERHVRLTLHQLQQTPESTRTSALHSPCVHHSRPDSLGSRRMLERGCIPPASTRRHAARGPYVPRYSHSPPRAPLACLARVFTKLIHTNAPARMKHKKTTDYGTMDILHAATLVRHSCDYREKIRGEKGGGKHTQINRT